MLSLPFAWCKFPNTITYKMEATMAIYAMTYDLNKDKNYEKLWAEFERLGCQKAARSFYFGEFNETAETVLAHFRNFIDQDDTFIVCQTSLKQIAKYKPLQGTNAWLNGKAYA